MRVSAVLLLGSLIAACGDDGGYVDPSVSPYLDRFVSDAATNGQKVSADGLTIRFVENAILSNGGTQYGYASGGDIELVKPYWDNATDARKEILLYHELGHALLGQEHRCGWNAEKNIPNSVMCTDVSVVESYWTANRDYYVQELFMAGRRGE